MPNPGAQYRVDFLRKLVLFLLVALFAKVFVSIVYEYRWYFPADFDSSAFLAGRREFFHGLYQSAFYAHIIGGPVALLMGAGLMFSGGRARFLRAHRWAGRILIITVVAVVVPSGLAMATRAYTGSIAGWGFGMLSFVTGSCAIATWYFARTRQFLSHRQWATRCFILLSSPLLLRIVNGALSVVELESQLSYQLVAWLSWLVPLATYEIWLNRPALFPSTVQADVSRCNS